MIDGVKTKYLVSHNWERAMHLRDVRAGRLAREEVCDADFLLRAAAEHHGWDTGRECPICGGELRDTLWIYGDQLGRRSGSARSSQEIAELTAQGLEFSVHRVEVCLRCRWNHLLETATAHGAC